MSKHTIRGNIGSKRPRHHPAVDGLRGALRTRLACRHVQLHLHKSDGHCAVEVLVRMVLVLRRHIRRLGRGGAVLATGLQGEGPRWPDVAPGLALLLYALDRTVVRAAPVAVARPVVPRNALFHREVRGKGPQVRPRLAAAFERPARSALRTRGAPGNEAAALLLPDGAAVLKEPTGPISVVDPRLEWHGELRAARRVAAEGRALIVAAYAEGARQELGAGNGRGDLPACAGPRLPQVERVDRLQELHRRPQPVVVEHPLVVLVPACMHVGEIISHA